MIEQPERYLETFAEAGANSVSVHSEVCDDLPAIARQMHELGLHASVALNPETAPDRVLAAADQFDMILVMSVHPGFGGQAFIPANLDKLRAIRTELDRRGLTIDVEIDGGIKVDNIAAVAAAGANVFVSGSGIFGHPDYREIMARMRAAIAHA
jgi:ribulose-phosphate 3-epimerase